jgi:CDGSH-type Zn-finger protein
VHTIRQCPSGALTYRRNDGGAAEAAPPVNLVRLRENGPLTVHAQANVKGGAEVLRATLCRCGASKTKPWCDNSHKATKFTASGEGAQGPSMKPLAERGGPLTITPLTDGPYLVQGNLEIVTGTGATIARTTNAILCRCGGSKNKPYCDGTHSVNRFKAKGYEA